MSVTNCIYSGFPYQDQTTVLSPSLSSANTLLHMFWAKLSSAEGTSGYQISNLGVSGTQPKSFLGIGIGNATSHFYTAVGTTAGTVVNDDVNSSIAACFDVWAHFAAVIEGPADGTSKVWRSYFNGTLWDSGTFTSVNATVTFDTVWVGVGQLFDGKASGRYAYVAVAQVASLAAAASIIAEAQTKDPKYISGVTHAWNLRSDYAFDVGGPNFATFGSVTFNAADNPTFPTSSLLRPNPAIQHLLVR